MNLWQTDHLLIHPDNGMVTDLQKNPLGFLKIEGQKNCFLYAQLPQAYRREALWAMADGLMARGAQSIRGDFSLDAASWYPCPESKPFEDVRGFCGTEIDLECVYTHAGDAERGLSGEYTFEITPHGSCRTLGRISLRLGMDRRLYYAGNIGYGIIPDARGHRYAAQACKLLIPLMQRHGMKAALITCRPDNTASRRTVEALGGRLIRYAKLPTDHELYQPGHPAICIYRWEFF